MPSNTSPKHRNLLGLLREARMVLNQQLWPYLRAHGLSITEPQWRVVRALTRDELRIKHGVETGRVAKDARILSPSLSGILARMEQSGLVTREKAPNDARLSIVKPTEKCLEIVESMREPLEAYYRWLEQRFGTENLAQLYRLLDMIIEMGPDAQPDVIPGRGNPEGASRAGSAAEFADE